MAENTKLFARSLDDSWTNLCAERSDARGAYLVDRSQSSPRLVTGA